MITRIVNAPRCQLQRCAAFCLALMATSLSTYGSEFSGVCPNGAPAREARYCQLFVHFNNQGGKALDTRIADAVGVKNAEETRSIGLVIAIDSYPNLAGADIPAARVDGDRLVDFLVNKQQFDEVIVLRNGDATVANIEYFLQDYLVNRAKEFNKKARLLVAYSGHGRYGSSDGMADTSAAFVLSAAKDVNGPENMYNMQDLALRIENLAERYFHVLTLINACYGAGFFLRGVPGGNPDSFNKPGSLAITAGSKDDLVPSLNPARGSLFFDLLISGVSNGTADTRFRDAFGAVSGDGTKIQQGGLTRSLELVGYLTSSYLRIVNDRRRSNASFELSDPWLGTAQAGIALGGFFFLSDYTGQPVMSAAAAYNKEGQGSSKTSNGTSFGVEKPNAASASNLSELDRDTSRDSSYIEYNELSANNTPAPNVAGEPLAIPAGPLSSIIGRPDIKIFKAPDVYPIQGYDFSSREGTIDWNVFATTPRPRFIYARAAGWKGLDPTFNERWSHAKSLKIDYGAYVKYDFCRSVDEQMARLSKVVPVDEQALPMAVEIVHPKGEDYRQLACLNAVGLSKAKVSILRFADAVHERYGKLPLLYGNRNNLSTLIDRRSDKFMIWLGSYGASGIQLRGRNPWTLWQFSGTLEVKGVGPNTTAEVFFGTEDQYKLFKAGKTNVALKAVENAK
ncbi:MULTISPECIES: GH25 family lysozyme [unclassified Caballeronia]|uniref:GH25 family lysozyme n=1 Tax=unclassified Caballeronia TaxID=2646786 RepID=UPI002028F37B|nr:MULTISPECIES: GH25 family lysozyme [unclassified Caballeronia]MDR5766154.1 GH25 family lysozyme [Caballeronia sp. LZ028]